MVRKTVLSAALLLACVPAMAVVFPGANTGAIPDCTGCTGGGNYTGASRDVTFNVTGVAAITDIGVRFTGTHSWIGDIQAQLISPGGTATHTLFQQIGTTTAAGFGDSSDLGGTYGFQNGSATNIHALAVAAACGATCVIPSGDSVTVVANPPNAGTATNMTAAFAGLTEPQITGTWTLRFRDGGAGDTGTITAANLFLNQTVPVELQSFSVD
jgi:subtilisin-like proprotein convertase family protein